MLHLPGGDVVAPEWQDLERKVREGDGLVWTGDPRLWLGIGVLENRFTHKVGRRLEVWRDNEDGSTSLVAHWLLSESHRVLFDLANMRIDRPGFVSTEARIDAHNDALEKAASEKVQEEMFETLDHAIRLDHDKNNPRNRFYLHGNRAGRA